MNIKNSNSKSAKDLKTETLSQVLNLLRTNTQNIFHLESLNIPGVDPSINNNFNDNIINNPLAQSTPIHSGNNNNGNNISPNVSPAVINKKDHPVKPKINHKHSRSATTAADYRLAQERARELALKNNPELLSIDWGRPRSYSEAIPPTILESSAPLSSTASPASKKKGKKEKRASGTKPLAPVMPFTSTPTRPRGNSLLTVETEVEKEDISLISVDTDPSSETLVALNASKDGRKLKKKANSQIIPPHSAPTTPSSNGYFDKFMKDFYPHLPNPSSSSTGTTPTSTRPSTPTHPPVCFLLFVSHILYFSFLHHVQFFSIIFLHFLHPFRSVFFLHYI